MLRIVSRDGAPVGGIPVIELFEVNIHPITFRMTNELAQRLQAYVFAEWKPLIGGEVANGGRGVAARVSYEYGVESDSEDEVEVEGWLEVPRSRESGSLRSLSTRSLVDDTVNVSSIKPLSSSGTIFNTIKVSFFLLFSSISASKTTLSSTTTSTTTIKPSTTSTTSTMKPTSTPKPTLAKIAIAASEGDQSAAAFSTSWVHLSTSSLPGSPLSDALRKIDQSESRDSDADSSDEFVFVDASEERRRPRGLLRRRRSSGTVAAGRIPLTMAGNLLRIQGDIGHVARRRGVARHLYASLEQSRDVISVNNASISGVSAPQDAINSNTEVDNSWTAVSLPSLTFGGNAPTNEASASISSSARHTNSTQIGTSTTTGVVTQQQMQQQIAQDISDVRQMKMRASENRVFRFMQVPPFTLCVSYKVREEEDDDGYDMNMMYDMMYDIRYDIVYDMI